MLVYFTDTFSIPLPAGHRFPLDKYRLLRERLAAAPEFAACELVVPPEATDAELELVHDPAYVAAVRGGRLTAEQVRRIGFPWSEPLVARSLRSCGATVAAARAVVGGRRALSLSGGTHHAGRAEGQGYCVFNDCAVAARVARERLGVGRVLVVDCDVHQGNGTAAIFAGDDRVFTFSVHGAGNFPARKARSDLDVALADGTGDRAYLEAPERGLAQSFARARPDLAFYLAGADPWRGDRLGRLALSKEGLAARDRTVFAACRERGVPVVTVMAGGYAAEVRDTVDIHAETVRQALAGAIAVRG